MNLELIDRKFPLVFAGFLVSAFTIPFIAAGCTPEPTQAEQTVMNEGYAERLLESIVIVTPRPGVECVVARGAGPSNPRMMSCYTTGPVQR